MKNNYEFEKETCGRCGGSGRYSYNPTDLDRCYGCGGSGIRFTKKGLAANKYFNELLETKVIDLKVGDRIWNKDTRKWHQINEIERAGLNQQTKIDGEWIKVRNLRIKTDNGNYVFTRNYDATFRCYPKDDQGNATKEAFYAVKKQAYEHQSKLTKQGKLMKKYQLS